MSTRFRLYVGLVLAAFGAVAQKAGTAIVVGMVHDSRGYQVAGVGGAQTYDAQGGMLVKPATEKK